MFGRPGPARSTGAFAIGGRQGTAAFGRTSLFPAWFGAVTFAPRLRPITFALRIGPIGFALRFRPVTFALRIGAVLFTPGLGASFLAALLGARWPAGRRARTETDRPVAMRTSHDSLRAILQAARPTFHRPPRHRGKGTVLPAVHFPARPAPVVRLWAMLRPAG